MNSLKKAKSTVKLFLQKTLGFNTYLYIFSLLAINRVKFEQEFHFFNNMIEDEGIILDIGANIGIMTTLMAQKSKNAQVWAFEPIPENIKALKRVVDHHKLKNVKIYETALGEKNGEIKMVMPIIDNVKMQGLSHVLDQTQDETIEPGSIYNVTVYKLDDMKEFHTGEKISAIKIDVENFEYPVLKGGEGILRKHKPVIYCELWDNEKKYLTIDYLRDLGYQVKIYEKNKLVDYRDQAVTNFFFIPKLVA